MWGPGRIAAIAACAAVACGPAGAIHDGENDAFGGPKADGFCAAEGSLEARGILRLVNDPATTVDLLVRAQADGGADLEPVAARNLVAARPFATLAELDAVKFVGPHVCTALRDLACEVDQLCTAPKLACAVANRSGHDAEIAALADPIARKLFATGDDCPASFAEVVAKLRVTDRGGCEAGGGAGMAARFVSGAAQVTGQPAPGRLVVNRVCDHRLDQGMLFALSDVAPDATALPADVEVMGFDSTAGIFNFYTLAAGQWAFHGSSTDFVTGASTSACAACHQAGGVIMRELATPWMDWQGHADVPGADALIGRFAADLGARSDGEAFEFITRNGNRTWNQRRAKHLFERGTVADLLRPLFCTGELNLETAAAGASPVSGALGQGDDLTSIPVSFFVDPRLKGFGELAIAPAVYHDAIVAAHQRLAGAGGAALTAAGAPAIDTPFDFAFPTRAAIDVGYVETLVQLKLIDDDFARDVLFVDFTRPILSTARCDLLGFAPDLAPGTRTAEAIRAGFVARLTAASPAPGSAAAGLLASLQTPNADHGHAVDGFLAACAARPQAALMADVLVLASAMRRAARARPLFADFLGLPVDDLAAAPDAHLDPLTCTLD